MKTEILAKNLEPNMIILINGNTATLIKFVDVGPKRVYVKLLNGKALSFGVDEKLEVVK